jgi:hypothetical protein
MSLDYSSMDASECGSVNFDVLLMEGFICHVCLPNPCTNGGQCVHHDGIYTFGGFSCDCDGTGYEGDICHTLQSSNYVAAELVLDLSLESVSGGLRESFISSFRADIAALAQVEPAQVVVLDIRGGSVVVSFRIVNAAPGSPATSPSEGLGFLRQSLVRGARLDRVGVQVDPTVLVITEHVDEAGNPLPIESPDHSPVDRSSHSDTDGATELLAMFAIAVLLGVLVGFACWAIRSKRSAAALSLTVEPELSKLESLRTTPPSTPDLELQAPRQADAGGLIRGIVNARVTSNGRREFKVRWADGRDTWVDSTAATADQIAKFNARKARHLDRQFP